MANLLTLGRPITPQEAKEGQPKIIPSVVYDVFNHLLTTRFARGNEVVITQDQVIDVILARMPELQRQEIFDNHWLDIENAYQAAGWQVSYSRVAYNESGRSFWTFIHGKG